MKRNKPTFVSNRKLRKKLEADLKLALLFLLILNQLLTLYLR